MLHMNCISFIYFNKSYKKLINYVLGLKLFDLSKRRKKLFVSENWKKLNNFFINTLKIYRNEYLKHFRFLLKSKRMLFLSTDNLWRLDFPDSVLSSEAIAVSAIASASIAIDVSIIDASIIFDAGISLILLLWDECIA